jgi:tetratricopeptide (TPR) repeat protein
MMLRKNLLRFALFFLLSGLALAPISAQQPTIKANPPAAQAPKTTGIESPSSLSILLQPIFTIPMGSSADLFGMSGAGSIGVEYAFPGSLQPYLSAGIDYAYAPLKFTNTLSVITAQAGGGMYLWLHPRIALKAGASLGYWFGMVNEGGAASGLVSAQAGLGVQYVISPLINIGLGVGYRYDLGLYQGLEVTASTSVFFSGKEDRKKAIQSSLPVRPEALGAKTPQKGRGIELANIELFEVFPVFHKLYDDHPVGMVTLTNKEKTAIKDVKLSFFVKQYMDSAKDCPAPAELAPGERRDVEIMSLLTDRVLEVTEATKVAGEITLEYRMDGELYREVKTVTMRLLDRNAMTWSDDRRPAAFVTAKDPTVLTLSKGVAGYIRDKGPEAMNAKLLTAMAIYSALDLFGVSYVADPETTFSQRTQNKSQADFLQFPRQTLEYKAGDCDDLSILYAALLESVAVETAFITVPGHIYLAFCTDLMEEAAARAFSGTKELIIKDRMVWIPVEVTERRGGFMKAWAEGAREWREATADGTAAFIPVRQAWQEYEPVQLPGGKEMPLPAKDAIVSAFLQEVVKFVDREITPRVTGIQDEIKKNGDTPVNRNRLGVLYAQYGRTDQAETEFLKAIARQQYLPALLNLGNIQSLKGAWTKAREYFDQAAKLEPKNPKVLLALSRTHYAAEQYDLARAKYLELEAVDKAIAGQFAYLGGSQSTGTRAGDVQTERQQVLWAE